MAAAIASSRADQAGRTGGCFSPEALGEKYYGQCIACHGSRGEGGIGPMLAGQAAADIVAKLTAYRAGEERGAQSAMMYPVAKPMTDADLDNIAAFVASL